MLRKTVASPLFAIGFALAACTPTPPPVSTIDRVQKGDDDMTCPQLQAEIDKMDGISKASMSQSDQSRQSMGTSSTVGSAAGLGASFSSIPFLGGAAQLAAAQSTTSSQQKMQQGQLDASDAKARKEHLLDIANRKHCG